MRELSGIDEAAKLSNESLASTVDVRQLPVECTCVRAWIRVDELHEFVNIPNICFAQQVAELSARPLSPQPISTSSASRSPPVFWPLGLLSVKALALGGVVSGCLTSCRCWVAGAAES